MGDSDPGGGEVAAFEAKSITIDHDGLAGASSSQQIQHADTFGALSGVFE